MTTAVIATKFFIPKPRPGMVARPRLISRLDNCLQCKVGILSASAGSGKTTLLGEWIAGCNQPVAWLSLDSSDSEPSRFLTYLVASIQTIYPTIGAGLTEVLQSPQLPPIELLLTNLLNELADIPEDFFLILDDYHVIDSLAVDQILAFLVEHVPPQLHLIISSREDPPLPLARLRAKGQLIEIRLADLRFTPDETTDFLNHGMHLNLTEQDIMALSARTEGWITGLQLAAISMQGENPVQFIHSFTGSHRYILDYLVEEVLQKQTQQIQQFLMQTSILDRFCAPLCGALLQLPASEAQTTLSFLESTNLFIIPLDLERRWFRYHHLFSELLRQRLGQFHSPAEVTELHIRASQWYESNNQITEAFKHASLAQDIERAERLIDCKNMPLHLRSVAMLILEWLASLSVEVKNVHPGLWVKSATIALLAGQTSGVTEKLQAAEQALQTIDPMVLKKTPDQLDANIRSQLGKIACARATLALTHYDPATMNSQAQRALAYLPETDLAFRFTANWALTNASLFLGDRATAAHACRECIHISQKSGDVFSNILSLSNLGEIQELQNQLCQAHETYQQVLNLAGEQPNPNIGEVHLGLARIDYEWNDLQSAEQHALQGLAISKQFDSLIDRYLLCEVFLARLELAKENPSEAASLLAQTEKSARQNNFLLRLPEIADTQILVLLRQNNLDTAAQLADQYNLSLNKARVLLAMRESFAALEILKSLHQEMEAKNWQDVQLKVIVLKAIAFYQYGNVESAFGLLDEALSLAESSGFIRLFVDEGEPMRSLLTEFQSAMKKSPVSIDQSKAAYITKLLASFSTEPTTGQSSTIDPITQREIEILKLIAQGLSNQEIGTRLFIALDTVKGHNRRIFEKLQVKRRTEAVARARELGYL